MPPKSFVAVGKFCSDWCLSWAIRQWTARDRIVGKGATRPCPESCYGEEIAYASSFAYEGDCADCPTCDLWLQWQQPCSSLSAENAAIQEGKDMCGHEASPPMPFEFRAGVIALCYLNCFLIIVWERILVRGPIGKCLDSGDSEEKLTFRL